MALIKYVVIDTRIYYGWIQKLGSLAIFRTASVTDNWFG